MLREVAYGLHGSIAQARIVLRAERSVDRLADFCPVAIDTSNVVLGLVDVGATCGKDVPNSLAAGLSPHPAVHLHERVWIGQRHWPEQPAVDDAEDGRGRSRREGQ